MRNVFVQCSDSSILSKALFFVSWKSNVLMRIAVIGCRRCRALRLDRRRVIHSNGMKLKSERATGRRELHQPAIGTQQKAFTVRGNLNLVCVTYHQ